jgi:hypothetical protein
VTDPLLRLLESLPDAEPDRDRAARVRSRCHAALARDRKPRAGQRTRAPFVVVTLVACLGAAYLVETVRQTLILLAGV